MNVFKMSNGCHFGYRPEKVVLSADENGVANAQYKKKVQIITREMLGSETLYKVKFEGDEDALNTAMVKSTDDSFREDEMVWLNVTLENLYFFDEKEQRIRKSESDEAYTACVECLKGE